MSFEVKIPAVGESVASAEIGQWHQQEGASVAIGDLLVTLETDKVSQEVTAEAAGTLTDLTPEGTEVEVGTVIARILEGDSTTPASSGDTTPQEKKPPMMAAPVEEPAPPSSPEKSAPAAEKSDITASPVAKKLAEEKGIGLHEVSGSGKGGTITKADVETAANAAASVTPAPQVPPALPGKDAARTTRKRMSPLRRKIANQLVSAQQTAAILTTFNEVDMSGVMRLRKELQEDFIARHGVKLGFMSFFVKATVEALKTVPSINARIEGDEVITNHFFDIGVAIGSEKGLIVPVLRDCEKKSFARIEQDIIDYATRARDGNIAISDLQGGVFTISNGGVYGSLLSTPILNPPQSGILGMHTIQQRPIALDGEVAIRPMMNLALSYDHRIVDGKEAVTFLIRIKDCIENPMRLLVDA